MSFNKKILEATNWNQVIDVYPMAKAMMPKMTHFFAEIDAGLFMKAYGEVGIDEDGIIHGEFKLDKIYKEKGKGFVDIWNKEN